MVATLSAGSAVVLFILGLLLFAVGTEDRLAGAAVLAGLIALSVAVMAHVVPPAPKDPGPPS
jgi:hypothetical protein